MAGVVEVDPDHAGRWSAGRGVSREWRYAVVVEAEGCPVRLADTVDVGWLDARRVDLTMRSCRGRALGGD